MKKLISVIFTLAAASIAFAQNSSLSDPDPTIIGADSAKQALREISVDLKLRVLGMLRFLRILV